MQYLMYKLAVSLVPHASYTYACIQSITPNCLYLPVGGVRLVHTGGGGGGDMALTRVKSADSW